MVRNSEANRWSELHDFRAQSHGYPPIDSELIRSGHVVGHTVAVNMSFLMKAK
jgi:hypothetical protein